MKILALDNATKKCGYAVLTNARPICYGVIEQNDKSLDQRLKGLYGKIRRLVELHKVDMIVCEDNYSHSNIQVLKGLCLLEGIILAIGFDFGVPVKRILASEWRKKIGFKTGENKAQKREVQKQFAIDFVNLQLGAKVTSDDVAEALCIGYSQFIGDWKWQKEECLQKQ